MVPLQYGRLKLIHDYKKGTLSFIGVILWVNLEEISSAIVVYL